MTNTGDTPNRLNVTTNHTYWVHFGAPFAAMPMHHVHGLGHHPRIKVSFLGGVSIELTPEAATELARRLPEAIAALPVTPDYSGALARIDDDGIGT